MKISVSNPSIATVDNEGNIIPKKGGTVIVTLKNPDNKQSFSFKVVVPQKMEIKFPNPVKIINLKIGQTYKLSIKLDPPLSDDFFVWTISNPKIATVEKSGIIKALKVGSTILKLRVTADNGRFEFKVNVSK